MGMKDRGVYETPGGTILYSAHEVLEMITVDKDTLHMKQKLAVDFADLVYNGKWFTPLREALSAPSPDKAQEYVTGTVKLKLYKGNIIPAGMHLSRHPVLRGHRHLRRVATTTRRTPPASSTSGACPTPSRHCGNRVS